MGEVRFDITLKAEDFGEYCLDDVKCRGCNGQMCGEKTPKLYEGSLVFVCHMGEAGREVLRRAALRAKDAQ